MNNLMIPGRSQENLQIQPEFICSVCITAINFLNSVSFLFLLSFWEEGQSFVGEKHPHFCPVSRVFSKRVISGQTEQVFKVNLASHLRWKVYIFVLQITFSNAFLNLSPKRKEEIVFLSTPVIEQDFSVIILVGKGLEKTNRSSYLIFYILGWNLYVKSFQHTHKINIFKTERS